MSFDRKAWHDRYVHTEKARRLLKEAARRYRKSDKGRAYYSLYEQSGARKQSAKKYIQQEHGRAVRKKHYDGYKLSEHGRYTAARCAAMKKDKEWGLTEHEYLELRQQACFYCRGPLNPTGIGLDRLDNAGGYTRDNVVSCCGACNILRGNRLTPEETRAAMEAVLVVRAYRRSNGY